MPGPALTPIATPLPAASSKGPDATAPGREADAPEAGFAGELQRRIQGDAGKETDTAASPEDTQAEEQGAAQAAAPQPELAALLAGLVRPVEPRPAPAASLLDAPESVGLETRLGPAGLATDSAADRARSPLAVAADAGQAANLADTTADAAGKPASPPPLETAASLRESLTERGPDAAATPTNSFAAIHAAALANLRGEPTQAAQAPLPIHVATPADSPAWPEEVGHRVSWMVGQHESQAELTLTPPQLGKIEVSITISGDQTSAQFVTATPAARELIEQSLPRLREILEQSGISLGQTDVGTSGERGDGGGQHTRGRTGGSDTNAAHPGAPLWQRRGEGLVDTFA
jgi:flagellar hook-length control protein FliK